MNYNNAEDCLWNQPLGWTPFGQDLTCGQWEQTIMWYIDKLAALDTSKETK